jgi:hypothetical protein
MVRLMIMLELCSIICKAHILGGKGGGGIFLKYRAELSSDLILGPFI